MSPGSIYVKILFFSIKNWSFWSSHPFSKQQRLKRNLFLGQNIWKDFHVLPLFFCTTSETKLGTYHENVDIRVASGVTRQL